MVKHWIDQAWDFTVRFRTWLLNGLLALALIAPEILNSPEVLAVIPSEWQRWFLVATFIANIWLRPRPAVRAKDPEVAVKKAADEYQSENL